MNELPQTTKSCPVCGQQSNLLMDLPQTFWGQRFSLHTCNTCALCYTFPAPSNELLSKIYSGDYWVGEKAMKKQGGLGRLVEKFNEIRLAMTIKPLLSRLPFGASLLEVGCGSGQLAAYLKKRGYSVEVVDIDRDMIDGIKRRYGITGYCGSMESIHFPRTYHAIIFNNVFEHLRHPDEILRKAGQLLSRRGFVFLEVPNIASLQFGLFQESWFALQIPQHLFHFSPKSLNRLALQTSFRQIWLSTFSPRVSAAGYVASLCPQLRPEKVRRSLSKLRLFTYLGLQILFLPLSYAEALAGRGSAVRVLYRKATQK